MLDLDSRKLIFINVTYNPTAEWITQQFRNAFLDCHEYPTLCICDNDQIFHNWFSKMLNDYFDMVVKRTPFRSPHKNGRVERFHLSLKTESFFDVTPINLLHSIRICREYQNYYNNFRPHQGIDSQMPGQFDCQALVAADKFYRKRHLGGKITSFEPDLRLAA